MSARPMLYFVCDRCGNYWRAYRAVTCPACRHKALWQYDREAPAQFQANAIRDPRRTVEPLA